MKGCPEGGEQNYLFGLYNQLSYEPCLCPHGCGTSVARKKADFFALYVSAAFMFVLFITLTDHVSAYLRRIY